MISNTNIGYNGRLGNQMFQFAALIGIADKNNYEVRIPEANLKLNTNNHRLQLNDGFNIESYLSDNINLENNYKEPFYEFNPEIFNCKDSTDLYGYFQTEKYFKHCENLIRNIFTFRSEIFEESKEFLNKFKKETVIINIRRGDYLKYPKHHPLCNDLYLNEALNQFNGDYDYICISDDIEWCKIRFPNINYVETKNIYIQLCILTLADNIIMANSSFTWWGAWLNEKTKKIIAPKLWFGEALKDHNTNDLYCNNWIKI